MPSKNWAEPTLVCKIILLNDSVSINSALYWGKDLKGRWGIFVLFCFLNFADAGKPLFSGKGGELSFD